MVIVVKLIIERLQFPLFRRFKEISSNSKVLKKCVLELARKEFPDYEYIMLGAIGDSNKASMWDWIDGVKFSKVSLQSQ